MNTRDQGSDFAAPEARTPNTKKPQASSPFQESLKKLARDKRAMVSLGVLLFFLLLALIGPPIYQHIGGIYPSDLSGPVGPEYYHRFDYQHLSATDQGPSAEYWLGSDDLGRDLFARLMQGLLISFLVALSVEVVDIVLGVGIGVLAGYYGGWIDQFLARFTDIMFAFPSLLFVILVAGIFGSAADTAFHAIPLLGNPGNARVVLLIISLSITVWPLMARYVRGQTLQLKEQQFVEAARTSGSNDFRIIMSHIVPNLLSLVVIASTLNIANTIISEAGVSLLGLGVQTPGSSLGLMISDGLNSLGTDPWLVLLPTIALTIIVLAVSFLGDGLRDAFDPRSKD